MNLDHMQQPDLIFFLASQLLHSITYDTIFVLCVYEANCFVLTHVFDLQLAERVIDVGLAQPQLVHWGLHDIHPSSQFLEYICGRDQLWPPPALAAG